jgi:single-strand DNA-binding protein
MPSFNKVMLIGRLTRDPELRYTSGGLAMVSFSIAVDRPFKDQQTGERKTDFFRCKAWRQKAEFVSNYVQKGRLVAVDGRIEMNEYVGQDGTKKYSTDIVADNVELLDGNRDGAEGAAPAGAAGFNGGGNRGGQDDGGYFPDEEAAPAPAPRRAAPPQPAAAAPRPAPRPAAAPAPAARPAARPAPARAAEPAYTDDDFDDSDPFADE